MTDIKRLRELAESGHWTMAKGPDSPELRRGPYRIAIGDIGTIPYNMGPADCGDPECDCYETAEEMERTLQGIADTMNSTPALLDELEAARKVVEAAKDAVSACHLRTHGFPEGDISDLDHSKLLPAIVALDNALSAHAAAGKGGGGKDDK